VFNTEHYLIQEVATRSVVFHPKMHMEFASDRLRWMDENARLNGSELQIGYDGDQAESLSVGSRAGPARAHGRLAEEVRT
jgi:hypothetical protein